MLLHPYSKGNSLSRQSVAISAIASNIGPNLLSNGYNQTTINLYNNLIKSNPSLAVSGVTLSKMKAIVVKNVSEETFNKEFIKVAPNILYSEKNAKYRKGTQNRMIRAMNVFSPTTRFKK